MTPVRRRWVLSLATLAVAIGLAAAWWLARQALRPVGLYSGWLLLALVLALTLFNVRKKLPMFPMLSASNWLQFHVYAGWLSVAVFVLHAGVRPPTGPLNLLLWMGYWLVAVSGVFGLWLSRWLPPHLARSGESLIFERIPQLRRQLQDEVTALVRQSDEETKSSTLADFHLRVLGPHFASKPPYLLPFAGDDAAHHGVGRELVSLRRFLNEREMAIVSQLEQLLEAKRNLDYQYAGQRLLKHWLFAHVPLTYGLLVLVAAHVWLVLHYSHRL
jgi:hypothetical protein